VSSPKCRILDGFRRLACTIPAIKDDEKNHESELLAIGLLPLHSKALPVILAEQAAMGRRQQNNSLKHLHSQTAAVQLARIDSL